MSNASLQKPAKSREMVSSSPVKTGTLLSTIIITQDEEKDIESCLESIKDISGEIVVVDSGSTDQTLDICKKFNARIFHHDWAGYSAQKQYALEKASGSWILNIDADEKVSSELAQEISNVISNNKGSDTVAGFHIPFRHYFLGKQMRFGGSRGETHIRLFQRRGATYGKDKVHEGIQVSGQVGRLKNYIDHFSYDSISDYLTKCNRYTSLIAEKKFKNGDRFHFWHHLRLPYEFIVRYFLKLGFLDGGKGLLYAALSSYYVWLKYAKLIDLEEGQ